MKIIITENQMDKFIQKMKMSIKKYGFVDTAKMIGIDKLKLAELSGLPIKGDTVHSENEIVVGDLLRDLVNQNKEYKNCTLHYSGLEGVVLWDCNFMDEENYYRLSVYATPYWDGECMIPVDISYFENTKTKEYSDEYDNLQMSVDYELVPKKFSSYQEIIDFMNNDYPILILPKIENSIPHYFDKLSN